MTTLNLITLTWNAADKLQRLKDSLFPALKDIDFKWFIKDNNSNDNTYELASTWGDNVKIIKYPNNLQNFSEGCNYLFNIAEPKDNDLILLLNNDVTFGDSNSLKNMISLLKNDTGIVGAKLLYTGTNKLQHAGVVFEKRYKLPLHFRAHEDDDNMASKNRYFQAVTGAVMLMRVSDYKNIYTDNKSGINGLDENLRWGFDDIDSCLAIKTKLNKKILYCGDTKIFHDESASLKKNPVNKLFMNHNANYFINKWRDKYSVDIDIYKENKNYNLFKTG